MSERWTDNRTTEEVEVMTYNGENGQVIFEWSDEFVDVRGVKPGEAIGSHVIKHPDGRYSCPADWWFYDCFTRIEEPAEPQGFTTIERAVPCEIVCLCGSTRFMDAFHKANRELSLEGKIVLTVEIVTYDGATDPQKADPEQKRRLDLLHLRKIELADRVHVLNVGGYMGESTRAEIEHAKKLGTQITYLEPLTTASTEPQGDKLRECPFCGSKAVIADAPATMDDGLGGPLYVARCSQHCLYNVWTHSKTDAIAGWNTRAADSKIKGLEAGVECLEIKLAAKTEECEKLVSALAASEELSEKRRGMLEKRQYNDTWTENEYPDSPDVCCCLECGEPRSEGCLDDCEWARLARKAE